MVIISSDKHGAVKRKVLATASVLVMAAAASPACLALATAPAGQAVEPSTLSVDTAVLEERADDTSEKVRDSAAEAGETVADAVAQAPTTGDLAVRIAKKYRGYPYVAGASGPDSFDCSGFTMYVYGKLGISLTHNAQAQYSEGAYVPEDELQSGDLVFFGGSTSSISHVGIYIGKGRFIHARGTGKGVVVDSLSQRFNYVGACRPY